MNQKVVIAILVIIILAGGAWLIWGKPSSQPAETAAPSPVQATTPENAAPVPPPGAGASSADPIMVGTWKSTDDGKFTRTFRADGTVTDAYEGDASATDSGTYTTVDPAAEAGFPAPAANFSGMTVVKVNFEKAGVMFFGINSMTETNLTMTYVGGAGKPLSFTKVK